MSSTSTTNLIPLLGHHRLDRLRATHVQAAFDKIAEQAEAVAAENAQRHRTLATAKQAWREHDAPAARAARTALTQAWRETSTVPGPVMVWTLALLTAAHNHRLHPLYLLVAHCGLRCGEAVGLRWEDINLDTGIIEIRQQIVQHGQVAQTAETKTHAGERTIIAAPTVLKALTAERARQRHRRNDARRTWRDTGLAFTTDTGTALHPSHITDQFRRLARDAGLPPIRLHDLRHGAATHALTAGVPIKTVSEMLGHSSYVITADTYTSVADEAKRAAAQAIADLLATDDEPEQTPPADTGTTQTANPDQPQLDAPGNSACQPVHSSKGGKNRVDFTPEPSSFSPPSAACAPTSAASRPIASSPNSSASSTRPISASAVVVIASALSTTTGPSTSRGVIVTGIPNFDRDPLFSRHSPPLLHWAHAGRL